jgi:general secretion pathway protein F
MRFFVRSWVPGTSSVEEVTVEAAAISDVQRSVEARGHTTLSIRAAPARRARRFDVAWWCRELHTLLRAGMTVVEAIETLSANKGDVDRDHVHGALLRKLTQGHPLSDAMTSVGVFPRVLVASVIASERTSTLADALNDYLRYDELLARLRRQIVSAAIYPAVVIGLGVLITCFLLMFVIPRFSRMYIERHGDLSAATEAVLWLSRLLQEHSLAVGAFIALGTGLVVWAARTGRVLPALMAIADRIDEVRRKMDHFRLANLYQSLALMVRGGYTIDEALSVGEALNLGPRLDESLKRARAHIAQGWSASRALAAAGLTEIVTERLLAVGERTGSFEGVLQTIADRHAQRFETFVEHATRIVEPLLLLLVALVVGGIVVMMYMPIFDMAGSIGGVR